MKDEKKGLFWVIRTEHRYYPGESGRKAFLSTSRKNGNENFVRFHKDLYRSVWRGWCSAEKATRLDW